MCQRNGLEQPRRQALKKTKQGTPARVDASSGNATLAGYIKQINGTTTPARVLKYTSTNAHIMRTEQLKEDERAADKVIVIALVSLLTISLISGLAYMSLDDSGDDNEGDQAAAWIDPVVEIEDENHSHTDLLAHRLQTENMLLIDYHNLNCDGNVAPPAELDNVAGRPCYPEFKNTGPTPGDSSEIAIEGNFLEDCEKKPDGTGGCYAYVSSYNQFEILDISEPNNIVLLSTYYAEIGRMIDIKVTPDNNWVLVNHELTNSDLDPIPQDDDANSGANRLDVIDVSDKMSPIKVAEWNNPPAGFHNQDLHVDCDWEDAPPIYAQEECHLFLYGADPYPEMVEGDSGVFYKGTQIFYVPLGFESWRPDVNDEDQNTSREIIRWGGYSPARDHLWWLTFQPRQRVPYSPHHRTSPALHLVLGCRSSHRRCVKSSPRS